MIIVLEHVLHFLMDLCKMGFIAWVCGAGRLAGSNPQWARHQILIYKSFPFSKAMLWLLVWARTRMVLASSLIISADNLDGLRRNF